MLIAFGTVINPAVVITAYGIGTIIAQLPLTPGGVGIVEGATTAVLVALGVATGRRSSACSAGAFSSICCRHRWGGSRSSTCE
jgi:hypothetical protein